jgi:hypothetical protein
LKSSGIEGILGMMKIKKDGHESIEVFVKTSPSNQGGRYVAAFKIAGLTYLPWQMVSQNGNATLFRDPREAIWPACSAALNSFGGFHRRF